MLSPETFAQHNILVTDPQPRTPQTDDTGLTFGEGWPGYLGESYAHAAITGPAGINDGMIAGAGMLGEEPNYSAIDPGDMLKQTSTGLAPNPEFLGAPGRVDRLATDEFGPAHSGSVESWEINGSRTPVARPAAGYGGPVGAGGDLGQYLSQALATSTYETPAQEISQLNILLGI